MESIYWLIALAIFIVIEIITLGLTTIWFAGGALVAFIASIFGVDLLVQVIIFAAVSVILLYFTRPIAVKYVNNKTVKTNYESLIGQEARVLTTIDNFHSEGSADLNGQEWSARAKNDKEIIEPNTKVTVVDIVGVKLIVEVKKEELE